MMPLTQLFALKRPVKEQDMSIRGTVCRMAQKTWLLIGCVSLRAMNQGDRVGVAVQQSGVPAPADDKAGLHV
jgi:hypothetical protein